MKNVLLFFVAVAACMLWAQDDGVYQWAIDVDGVISKETGKPPRAYLWIPPQARSVRAVVIGMHNMLEEPIFAHPAFRTELAKADVAVIWVTPMIPQNWERLEDGEVAAIESMLEKFAKVSGRTELANAMMMPIGHSAMATYPYLLAAARPDRVRCAVSIKGDWPEKGRSTFGAIERASKTGVPLLLISGEYEDGYGRREKARYLFEKVPEAHFSMWVDVGGGHFDWSDELCGDLGRWFAVMARSPKRNTENGVRHNGFWYPNEELMQLVRNYESQPRGNGKFTVLGYEYGGKVLKQNPKAHLQVIFGTREMEFSVKGVFDSVVSEGRPTGWTNLAAGSPNPRPAAGEEKRIKLQKIQGPVEHVEGDKWQVRYCRYDPSGRRARSASLQMVYPGDDCFKRSVQQAEINIPWPRQDFKTGGTFKIKRGFSKVIPSGFGAYVREGPAIVQDGRMVLKDVPEWENAQLKITLVVYDLERKDQPVIETYTFF